ncbi:hypothetical protein LZC95_29525 [Pendulispora brunnea]|uniref:DUF7793 domain-containing protein n=1 Tax=Pendulispora brunnea TaxID=2905690 RepID=A0ABZ2JVU4_9BACT
MAGERFRTELGEAWFDDENGIVRFAYFAGGACNLEGAKKVLAVEELASAGKRLPILIDVRLPITVDQEARAFFARIKSFSAFAFLVDSPVSTMMTKIFAAVHEKELVPTKLFNAEREAIDWLQGFLE